MKSMISASFLGALALVLSLPGEVEASDLVRCASVEDDTQRLACYDRLAEETLANENREHAADADEEVAERNRIISRCRDDMGEHGSAMVKFCAEEDLAAYRSLQNYPVEHFPFVERCTSEMGRYGWSMVKFCADEDIDAERALSDMLAD